MHLQIFHTGYCNPLTENKRDTTVYLLLPRLFRDQRLLEQAAAEASVLDERLREQRVERHLKKKVGLVNDGTY